MLDIETVIIAVAVPESVNTNNIINYNNDNNNNK